MKRSVAVFAGIHADGSCEDDGNNIERNIRCFIRVWFFYVSHNYFFITLHEIKTARLLEVIGNGSTI